MRQLTGYARLLLPYNNTGWITLDERDLLQRQIFATGQFDPEVWNTLQPYATENEIVWDIGANIGSFSIQAMLDARVIEVHCFEPQPQVAKILGVNLSLNKGKYRIHEVGLSDRHEQIRLFNGPSGNMGQSSFGQDRGFGYFDVSCVTIDELIKEGGTPPPTLMKVDVEGWEEHVFKGAADLFRTAPPRAIVFESACDQTTALLNNSIKQFLEYFGYRISWIPRPSGIMDKIPDKNIFVENFLAEYIIQTSYQG